MNSPFSGNPPFHIINEIYLRPLSQVGVWQIIQEKYSSYCNLLHADVSYIHLRHCMLNNQHNFEKPIAGKRCVVEG